MSTDQIVTDVKSRKTQFLTAVSLGAVAACYAHNKQLPGKEIATWGLGGAMVGLAVGYFLDKNAPK